jgi:zinc transporter ZupT
MNQGKEFKDFLKDEKLHIHEHDDHFHVHEHFHGDADNIIVSTIGLVLHSIADGLALGASLFCNKIIFLILMMIL